jgi:hypothetical protein
MEEEKLSLEGTCSIPFEGAPEPRPTMAVVVLGGAMLSRRLDDSTSSSTFPSHNSLTLICYAATSDPAPMIGCESV